MGRYLNFNKNDLSSVTNNSLNFIITCFISRRHVRKIESKEKRVAVGERVERLAGGKWSTRR